jgi:hypothetical protein
MQTELRYRRKICVVRKYYEAPNHKRNRKCVFFLPWKSDATAAEDELEKTTPHIDYKTFFRSAATVDFNCDVGREV